MGILHVAYATVGARTTHCRGADPIMSPRTEIRSNDLYIMAELLFIKQ